MTTATASLEVKGLGKHKMAELTSKAKRLGMTPERYVRALVEEDLALDRQAKSTTFAKLMGSGREVDETELDQLVEQARTRHHQRMSRKR